MKGGGTYEFSRRAIVVVDLNIITDDLRVIEFVVLRLLPSRLLWFRLHWRQEYLSKSANKHTLALSFEFEPDVLRFLLMVGTR